MDRRIFDIGEFRVDGNQRRLFDRAGVPVPLSARAFDVLMFLVQRPGELLDKGSLMNAVWPDTVVEESNLTQCVFTLRRALGENAGEHRYIVTVPGRGYQFVAPVTAVAPAPDVPETSSPGLLEAERAPAAARMRSARFRVAFIAGCALLILGGYLLLDRRADHAANMAATDSKPAPLRTVAVLPFDDLSPQKDMEYFADGIAEEIIGALSKVHGLQVSGRRSAFSFKGSDTDVRAVGEKLNVASILEGSVRKDRERLRITAQLTRTSDGVALWTGTYDRTLGDVLDIQGTIAREVVTALDPMFSSTAESPQFPALTGNQEAYSAYLRGRYLFARGSGTDIIRASIEFKNAVTVDPGFALAHAWLARCYTYMATNTAGDNVQLRTRSYESMNRAITQDPALTDLWWMDLIQGYEGRLFTTTASRLERALKANPSDADLMFFLSWNYRLLGRREDAFAMIERAYFTDPLAPAVIVQYAYASYFESAHGDRTRFLNLADEIARLTPDSPLASDLRAALAFNEGRALDWDRNVARQVAVAPHELPVQGYLSIHYADLGAIEAAMHHARVCQRINPKNAAGWYNEAHIRLFSGNIDASRAVVRETLKLHPDDYLALRAHAELQYFSGDCAASIEAYVHAQPELGQPPPALDTIEADSMLPILTWCLRRQGNLQRAKEVTQAFELQHPEPMTAGYMEGLRARMAAANGDRVALIRHLRALAGTPSMEFAFSRHEPMIGPYLEDVDVKPLLAKLEARRAEWRRVLPYSSMRVPVPGIDAPPKTPAN